MKRAAFGALIIGVFAARNVSADDPRLLIRPLASIEMLYVEDGAADASLVEHPEPRVKAIVDLGEKALPLLIDCLVDVEPTAAIAITYPQRVKHSTHVPLGYLCLDILMGITDGPDVYVEECADDGLGACVWNDFYFRPDVYATHQDASLSRAQVAAVQRKWRHVLATGKIWFVYPAWWAETAQ